MERAISVYIVRRYTLGMGDERDDGRNALDLMLAANGDQSAHQG